MDEIVGFGIFKYRDESEIGNFISLITTKKYNILGLWYRDKEIHMIVFCPMNNYIITTLDEHISSNYISKIKFYKACDNKSDSRYKLFNYKSLFKNSSNDFRDYLIYSHIIGRYREDLYQKFKLDSDSKFIAKLEFNYNDCCTIESPIETYINLDIFNYNYSSVKCYKKSDEQYKFIKRFLVNNIDTGDVKSNYSFPLPRSYYVDSNRSDFETTDDYLFYKYTSNIHEIVIREIILFDMGVKSLDVKYLLYRMNTLEYDNITDESSQLIYSYLSNYKNVIVDNDNLELNMKSKTDYADNLFIQYFLYKFTKDIPMYIRDINEDERKIFRNMIVYTMYIKLEKNVSIRLSEIYNNIRLYLNKDYYISYFAISNTKESITNILYPNRCDYETYSSLRLPDKKTLNHPWIVNTYDNLLLLLTFDIAEVDGLYNEIGATILTWSSLREMCGVFIDEDEKKVLIGFQYDNLRYKVYMEENRYYIDKKYPVDYVSSVLSFMAIIVGRKIKEYYGKSNQVNQYTDQLEDIEKDIISIENYLPNLYKEVLINNKKCGCYLFTNNKSYSYYLGNIYPVPSLISTCWYYLYKKNKSFFALNN